jgi:hypothetical protein
MALQTVTRKPTKKPVQNEGALNVMAKFSFVDK